MTRTDRKHLLVATISILVIAGLGVLSYQAYHSDMVRDAANAASEKAHTAVARRVQAVMLQQQKAQLKASCDQAQTYYDSLTAVQQKKVAPPTCTLSLIQ